MFDAARKDGIYPVVWEGYRTYEEQQKILDDKIKAYINEGYSQSRAERTAKEWVALPGTSEHQLGIAVDINADKSKSSNDEVYTWLAANAHNYGFCIDKEGVTEEWLNSKAKSARMYGKLCKFGDEEKAIQKAQQISGVVISSDQKYVWEKGNRDLAYSIEDVALSKEGEETSLEACERYMKTYDAQKVDLTGCTLDQVLYVINRGCPVIALTSADHAILLTGYTKNDITYIDPENGESQTVSISEMEGMVSGSGNTFIGYIK